MLRKIDQDRIDKLRTLISRILKADFNNRVKRTDEDDIIESLLIQMNWMTEEVKDTLQSYHIHSPVSPSVPYTGMVMLLDTDFKVIHANKEVTKQLGISNELLLNTSFGSYLSASSLAMWKTISKDLLLHLNFETLYEFQFQTPSGLQKKFLSTITSFKHPLFPHPLILVTTCSTCLKSKLLEMGPSLGEPSQPVDATDKPSNPFFKNKRDVKLVQEVRAYLLKHLDEPLPTQQELAYQFGTNASKLKIGFKAMYAITLSQFITEERLKRAKLLLESVDMSFKQIAYAVGYRSYPSFSRAFKRVYGMSPMAYRNAHQGPLL